MYDCCQMEQSQNIINRIGPTVAPPANCSPLLLLAVQSVAITGDPLGTINLFVYKWWTPEYKGSVSVSIMLLKYKKIPNPSIFSQKFK